jgi:chromosome segregation ATPase
MKTRVKIKKERVIATVAVLFLFVSLIGTGVMFKNNRSLSNQIKNEKLNSEVLLQNKILLLNEVDQFNNQINSLLGKNAELDQILSETSQKLSQKENEINKIVRENANIKMLKQQLSELNKMKSEFESQLVALNGTISKLNSEKEAMNKSLALLQEENKQLSTNLAILSAMTADNYLVETTKRKNLIRKSEQLTVVGKRARKMAVSFKIPENVAESISFKVTKPDGKQVEGKEQGITHHVIENEDDILMASESSDVIKVSKKIEMVYQPKEKLKAGIYKIEMYNGKSYIGSCNVKLR